jgi:hypothetical protein
VCIKFFLLSTLYKALRLIESRRSCFRYDRESFVSEAITGSSIAVKLPGYDRALFVSDVTKGVSVVR